MIYLFLTNPGWECYATLGAYEIVIMTVAVHVTSAHRTDTLWSFLTPLFVRIAGDTALDKNIHESVSAQIKKNFAKSKWKVSQISS